MKTAIAEVKDLIDQLESRLTSRIEKLEKRLDKAAEAQKETNERLDHLEAHVPPLEVAIRRHLDEHASNPPARKRAPRVTRGAGGRVYDPLLAELANKKADIGLSTRQLAGLLGGYPRKTVSNWLNRVNAPAHPDDRARIQEWIDLANAATQRTLREWREKEAES